MFLIVCPFRYSPFCFLNYFFLGACQVADVDIRSLFSGFFFVSRLLVPVLYVCARYLICKIGFLSHGAAASGWPHKEKSSQAELSQAEPGRTE